MAKILIVDDSMTMRKKVRMDLATLAPEYLEAPNGLDALEALRRTPGIDLVICDVNMDRMDGLAMCEEKAKDQTIARVPVLMMTTESGPVSKARGKAAGVAAWIVKPYQADKLVEVVRKLVAT